MIASFASSSCLRCHFVISLMYIRSQNVVYKLVAIQLTKSCSRGTVFVCHRTFQGPVDMFLRNCANTSDVMTERSSSGVLIKTIYHNVSTNAYLQ